MPKTTWEYVLMCFAVLVGCMALGTYLQYYVGGN